LGIHIKRVGPLRESRSGLRVWGRKRALLTEGQTGESPFKTAMGYKPIWPWGNKFRAGGAETLKFRERRSPAIQIGNGGRGDEEPGYKGVSSGKMC